MDVKIFRINYKSDFILTLNSDAGWMTPFCIKFWTGAPSRAYFVSFDGITYTHCAPVEGEPTKLLVQFDDHHLPIGDLKFQIAYHFTVADFPDDTEDEVINPASIIVEIDGEQYQVMLDFTGETAPEIAFSLPAYANEAQRIANEQQRIIAEEQRIANEQTRIADETTRQQNEEQRIQQESMRVHVFAQLKQESEQATDDANAAASLANEKAQLAADKAALAQSAATLANAKAQLAADKAALAASAAQLANDKAALAQQKAEYAQTQGTYAKNQGDYAKQQGDYAKDQGDTALADHLRAEADHETAASDHTRAESDHSTASSDHTQAGNDHTRAESDHGIAVDDHTQAGNDHTRAESDHGIAADDHTQAGNDHTRAESDHTRAENDHAAVEVYVDSLGAFDISAYHATGGVLAKYADLTSALGTNGANIPEAIRKGGMSVKFVLSSDNKYVQYFLTKNTWSTSEGDWEKMNLEEEVSQLGQQVQDREVSKDLVVQTGQQQIMLQESDYGNKVAVRIVSFNGAYLSGSGFSCQARKIGGSADSKVLRASGEWAIFESDVNYDRLYIRFNGTITQAGTVVVEIVIRSAFMTTILDTAPVENSTHLITSGAVYEAVAEVEEQTQDNISTINGSLSKIQDELSDIDGNVVPQWFQGGVTAAGKKIAGNTRVSNLPLYLATKDINIQCSGDVKIAYARRYKTAAVWENGGTTDVDFIAIDIAAAEVYNKTFLADSSFPYLVVVYQNKNGASLDLLAVTVSQNTIYKIVSNFIDDTNERLDGLESDVADIIGTGNSSYYGIEQSFKITDDERKIHSELIAAHLFSNYPYTRPNQSVAVFNNKAFCFNDTNHAAEFGFCVVLNATTGDVIARITDIPSVVDEPGGGYAHLNNACFTNQYYSDEDTYPLLLLTRGDYATTVVTHANEMYVFRITEPSPNNFVFTLIKTIIFNHNYLTYFNPSWCYDANRKMIWGYCMTEPWQWNLNLNIDYRKIQVTTSTPSRRMFKAFGATHVYVESSDTASQSVTVKITIGTGAERTINVAQGGKVQEIFAYSEFASGVSGIQIGQNVAAFSGHYNIYKCDENGNNRVPIELECAIIGFASPELSTSETVTINNSDFTKPVFIDRGTFQGGCCANGKLFLPYHDFSTINFVPVSGLNKICLIVEPTTGYIESVIKLVSDQEPEGCAFYDGALYISHHNGNATEQTTKPSFELFKYFNP